jgi:hypothetical protein
MQHCYWDLLKKEYLKDAAVNSQVRLWEFVWDSFADPDPFDTDPACACHLDTDPDPELAFHFDMDPDLTVWSGSGSLPFKEVMYRKQYFLYILTWFYLSVGPTGPNQKAYFDKLSLPVNVVVLVRVAYGSGCATSIWDY